jgi:Zn-dependent M28 family amino/carboxypeptidase
MFKRFALTAFAVCVSAAVLAGASEAATPTDTTPLQDTVKVGNDRSGIRQHLRQLQVIADRNGGTRATGTLGHVDSLAYVRSKLDATGYYTITKPVLGATYAVGRYLVDHPEATVSLTSSTRVDRLQTNNLIAETKTGRTDRTVIVGAHLDSVPAGPGINDDGSGTSTDREIALQMARLKIQPVNRVRFIWFAGEEQGLLGSTYYADQLSKKQVSDTAVMLDFDMLASPNYAKLSYDGDGSSFGVAGPNGSAAANSGPNRG